MTLRANGSSPPNGSPQHLGAPEVTVVDGSFYLPR